jgi:hypothetical protein
VIFIVLSIGWAVLLVFLMLIGFIIGLIIGFLILLFLIGGLNVVLTDEIWNIHTKDDWKSLLAHGFVLFIALIFAHVPGILINLVVPSLATIIAVFIVYCFSDGYVSKKIAEFYEITDDETNEITEYDEPP